MNRSLGGNIKSFRKNKGFTQEELADLLSVTPQAVSRWESEVGMPDVSMLVPLAQVLGVSTDALLGYDSMQEDEDNTRRIRETVEGMWDNQDRAGSALKICEYLGTETNLNPSNYEIIKDYVQETANLSMHADPVLGGNFQDEAERIEKIYKDAIKKGTYLISHSTDRTLIDKTHYAIAWIYIHKKEFDKAREHVNVLPSMGSNRSREPLDMEITFFEKGFEDMKDVITKNNTILSRTVFHQLNTVALNYGWWEKKEEALKKIDWCEEIVKSFAGDLSQISKEEYLHVRSLMTFYGMVAYTRGGEKEKAEKRYQEYRKELEAMEGFTEEQKEKALSVLDNEIAFHNVKAE